MRWRGEIYLFVSKENIKHIKPPKCSKTYLQTSLIPQLSHRDTPDPRLKGGGAEVGGRMGERRGGGCVMAVVTRIALHHL